MSRLHSVAAVLIGTSVAAAAYAPNGQHQLPTRNSQQATPSKVLDLSAMLSNKAPSGLAIAPRQAQSGGSSTLGSCPCAGSPPEGEPNCGLPIDTVNGGCNSAPIVYSPIAIGGSVCGTAAWDGSTRDTDWYQFTLATPSPVTWTVTSEFPGVLFIVDNTCGPNILAGPAFSSPCVATPLSTGTLPAGTYAAFFAPDFGGPPFPCGPGGDYQGTLTNVGCTSPANDGCASATAISGNGPWFSTNVCAIQDGPALCGLMGSDVWFNWTANITGNVTFNTCNPGTTYDTVLSVYDGAGCTGTNLGCNDDVTCNPIFRSGLTVPVVLGNVYKVQVGGYNGAQGNIELNVVGPPPPAGPCDVLDDGTTDNSVGTNNPADDILWLQSMSDAANSTTVTAIGTAWGSVPFGGGPPDGTAARVGIWSDPNNDGNPNDAVLLQSINIVVAGSNTDAIQTTNLAPPVLVTGRYFVGASCQGGTFQAPLDQGSGPSLGRAWIAAQQGGGQIDYTNLAGASIPPIDEDGVAPGVWLLRATCGSPITTFCSPGNAGVIGCPCGNPPSGLNRGCNNFGAFSGGAALAGSGNPSLSADTLSLTATSENNTALTVFWTGTTTIPAGTIHGAGVRCVTGLKRIYTGSASSGAITRPGMGGPTVSAATGNIVAGQTRHYFTVYRDPSAAGPCANTSSTVNLSNGVSAVWGP